MRLLLLLAVAYMAAATPIIDVFDDASFTLPEEIPLSGYSEYHSRAFEYRYLIRVDGAEGRGQLLWLADLQSTGRPRLPYSERLFSHSLVFSPFELRTINVPGANNGSSPVQCIAHNTECRSEFTFGETFELTISGELISSYAWSGFPSDEPPSMGGNTITTSAHVWLERENSVYLIDRDGTPVRLDGATITVTPVPEPTTAALSIAGLLLAWGLTPSCQRLAGQRGRTADAPASRRD